MKSNQINQLLPLLSKYNVPGPRYTSYPPSTEWHDSKDQFHYMNKLKSLKKKPNDPISIYVHIPFCKERCLFCACNVIVRKEHTAAASYIEKMKTEITRVSEMLGFKPKVSQLHFGGGTPTYLYPEEMIDIMRLIEDKFDLTSDAEIAIEIDPAETSTSYIKMLCRLGFNRFSFGVQDFDTRVQEAVHRVQSFSQTCDLIEEARKHGIRSINIDLIYGLPLQTLESFYDTLVKTSLLNPDRVALFSYAHVPWVHKHQQVLDHLPRPDAEDKLQLLMMSRDFFLQSNMEAIGLDHFTTEKDELYQAYLEGRLQRNFMGYSVKAADTVLGFGSTSIGFINGSYFQNTRSQMGYEKNIQTGHLANESFYDMTDDDKIRKLVIMEIMINGHLHFVDFNERTGLDFTKYFEEEIEELSELSDDGLIEIWTNKITVTEKGW